jgi:phage terminase large subunit-like protein
VVALYRKYHADKVVIEVNNGGELFSALFAREAPEVRIKAVRAGKDKFSRAEPVAAFYEKGIVHHLGVFPELEKEMCACRPGKAASSPDRMDALVWAVAELALSGGEPRFFTA